MSTNFTIRTTIVKASAGKSAVASAAYMAAEKLYDEKLGKSFSYTAKEAVVHKEILLPEHAPKEYSDRETLWNEVQAANNKSNSRYARQLIIAIPHEWNREESISRTRDFLQREFVAKGFIVDFCYHELDGNHHVHAMVPIRPMGPGQVWQPIEKKVYALDSEGNRIPVIDPATGEQKVRERIRDGYHSVEKLWERVTVQTNPWNSKRQLVEMKKAWAEHCNQYLEKENHIDYRSYEERGITDKLPQVHEGPEARRMESRGVISQRAQENRERKALNEFFDKMRTFIENMRERLHKMKQLFCEGGKSDDLRRGISKERPFDGDDGTDRRLSGDFRRSISGNPQSAVTDFDTSAAYKRLSEYRSRIKQLAERVEQIAGKAEQSSVRERELANDNKKVTKRM